MNEKPMMAEQGL